MATSTLNPNAPVFVPLAYRAVEDFSDQWWDLVQSSPWFRDYWLQECYVDHDPQFDLPFSDIYDDAIPDFDLLFDDSAAAAAANNNSTTETQRRERGRMDLSTLGLLKWRKPRGEWETTTKYGDKVPKIVNMRVSPRPIKQPR